MTIPLISPADAKRRLDAGEAVLIDIREPDEYAREHIAQSQLNPLSTLVAIDRLPERSVVIFHCQGGTRTCANAERLRLAAPGQIQILDGGLNAWKAAGLPTVTDRVQPLPMQRQVMIVAGAIIVASLSLAYWVSPWFAGFAVFMGCGLMFAGISGWCGLAKLLARMPWNAPVGGPA